MKKYLLSLITLTFFLCEASFTGGGMAFATPASLGNGVTWELDGTTLTIGYTGEGSGVMPDYASETGMPWNGSKTSITSIVVEEGVTRIGNYAFAGCTASESVSLPNSMEIIGYRAFLSNGFSSITIPENVIAIGDEAFKGCSMTSVVWNARNCVKYVTSAGAYTSDFSSASNPFFGSPGPRTTITSFTFGETAEIVPKYVCYSMSVLSSVTISDNVTTIGDYAFQNCSTLTAITIPESVETIGGYAFNSCTGITSITIPSSVTSIGTYAFKGSGLTSITIPNSVTSLGTYVFQGCTALASVTLPSEITALGTYAFEGCTALTSITIPSKVTSIGNYAFKGCTNLASVTVPNSVTSIGTYAFQNCSKLANITIPQGVTTISNYAFDGCATLKAITIPSSVTSIGNYAFHNCSTMVRVNFPSALTSIGTSAFENTPKLKSIPLASATSLTSIGASAFALSSADTTAAGLLVIPSGVTSIGGNAFKNRSGITGVVICNTSTSNWTNCSAATTFTGTPTDIPVYVYSSCSTHYQSATGWDHFASAGYTTSQTISNMDCGTTASTLYASLNLRTGSLTFSGSKCNMKNYNNSSNKAPWAAYKEAIKSVTFNSYVQTVGEYAFYECGALATVNTGSATNLTSIGQRAFQYCRALTSITIPASVTSMSAHSFYDTGLTSVTWNAKNCPSITSAGISATPFANINFVDYNKHPEKLTSFTFGSEVEVIPAYLCYGLTGLTSITIPSKVTSIGSNAFATCSALASVTIPTSVTTINSGAFGTCNALTSVKYVGNVDQWCGITFGNSTSNPTYFSHSLKLNNSDDVATSVSISASTIGKYAFERNTELTSVILSSAVDNFQTSAFDDCTGLTSLRFDGTLAQWCDNTFANNEANPLYYAHHFYLNSGTELTNLEIPEAISSISDFAFYNGSGFESISVYSTTSWGANTFYGCVTPTILGDVIGTCGEHLTWRLNGNTLYIEGYGDMENYANKTSMPWYPYRAQIQNVEFVDEATSVGNYAFNSLTNIQSVSFGSGIETIGSYSFTGCTGLTGTLTIGEGTTTINQNAFQGCTNITRVELNSGLTFLGYYAFYGCSNLEAITVPSSLETCNGYVFMSCNKLEAVYYEGSVDDWCGINFVSGSSSSPANNAIAKLYVDGNTETYLTEARITASAIGNYAFYNNKELTSVIITSAESVGTDAFHSCSNLARLEVDPVTPPTTANNNVFWGVTKTIPFYIPAAGASAYADAARWSDFADNRFLFGSCGENLSFVFAEATGILTISGSGAMTAFGSAGAVPWYSFRSDIKAIVLESGVTTIGNYAFYGCNNEFFTSISIPEGVTSLGNSAFNGCTHLASVTLPSSLESIGSSAFHSNAFTSISIPSSVSTISSYAFKNCANLTSIVVPNITILNEETFYGCSSLGSVTLPNTLTSVKKNTFVNCSSLTSITIPENVEEIVCVQGSGSATCPFSGCTSLTSVVWNARACGGFSRVGQYQEYAMPFESIKTNIESFTFGTNVTSIPSYVCHGMTGLTDITIPASVTTIGANAFDGCTNITTVTSNATSVPSIASSTFPTAVEDAATLYVPATVSVRTAYSNDTYWSEFDHMLPYILSFNMNGHGDAIDPICVNSGRVDEAQKPADPADADYHSFSGWYQEAGCSTPFTFGEYGTVVNADKTIYAKWTIYNYQVTFDMQGHGSSIAAQTIDHNELVEQPSAPSETGYTFGGWFKEAGCTNAWSFSEDYITSATTLYAKWTINSYDVTFDLQGHGDAIDAQSVNYNGLVSEPTDPSAEGFTFGGWFKEAGCSNAWDFSNDHITAATTLYAKWTENVYTFADTDTDNSKIAAAEGKLASSITIRRTIWKDGYYNSLCLPFDLSAEQIAASPLAGYKALKRLSAAAVTGEGEERVLNIQLEPISEINAGEPCFISYEVGENIVNPEFNNVTVTASAPGSIVKGDLTCNGLYASSNLGTATTNLFVGENNTLYWPAEGKSTIKGLRAYFSISPSSPAVARGMRVRFVDRMPTGIEEAITNDQSPITNKIIREGQLFILRDGKTYNAQGALIK